MNVLTEPLALKQSPRPKHALNAHTVNIKIFQEKQHAKIVKKAGSTMTLPLATVTIVFQENSKIQVDLLNATNAQRDILSISPVQLRVRHALPATHKEKKGKHTVARARLAYFLITMLH